MSDIHEKPILAIIVPCYCEEEVLPETMRRLSVLTTDLISSDKISEKSYILFVDDGSSDNTWELICQANQSNSMIKGLKLSRNFGHQNALVAGMEHVQDACDCVVTIDADLQDDLSVIRNGIDEYRSGTDIIYFARKERKNDSFFKKNTALLFYKIMSLMGAEVVYNHADYRLISNKVLLNFLNFKEVNLFLRGIFPIVGFKSSTIFYDRHERFAGISKYPVSKMVAFAIDGITSFTVIPLRFVSTVGLIVFFMTLFMGCYVFIQATLTHRTIPGWASTVLPIYFLGGIQLLSLGVIGEYVGKIYKEVKNRPRYIIEEYRP